MIKRILKTAESLISRFSRSAASTRLQECLPATLAGLGGGGEGSGAAGCGRLLQEQVAGAQPRAAPPTQLGGQGRPARGGPQRRLPGLIPVLLAAQRRAAARAAACQVQEGGRAGRRGPDAALVPAHLARDRQPRVRHVRPRRQRQHFVPGPPLPQAHGEFLTPPPPAAGGRFSSDSETGAPALRAPSPSARRAGLAEPRWASTLPTRTHTHTRTRAHTHTSFTDSPKGRRSATLRVFY